MDNLAPYLGFGGQTPEAEAGGGEHLQGFCWIGLLLTATERHWGTEADIHGENSS